MLTRLIRGLLGRPAPRGQDPAEESTVRANALRDSGRHEEALDAYGEALRRHPRDAQVLYHRGNCLMAIGRLQDALSDFKRAVEIKPDHTNALYNAAVALQRLKRPEEALAEYERVLGLAPNDAEALNNHGIVLSDLQRHEEALASYDRALACRPGYADALHNRALALLTLKRLDDAIRSLESLSAAAPEHVYVEGKLLSAKMLACDWDGLNAVVQRIRTTIEEGRRAVEPFPYHAICDSLPELRRCAEICAADNQAGAGAPVWNGERYRHSRIRVGYVAGELREHATAFLTAQLFERHDRTRFELYGFDNGWDDGSEVRARINRAFDEILDVSRLADADAAAAIRSREIDLLVDLNGYCGLERQGVFARRPCPVQVSYLGWPGTLGAAYMDYILADRCVIPSDHAQYYSESVVYLPDTYQVNDASSPIAPSVPVRNEAGLPDTGFVFCCFNSNHKITPEVFEIWMRLLRQIEGSVLWLLEDNPAASRNLRREAERRGIAAGRLVFARRLDRPRHLARHRLADLFLDTLPYNAHTTASDALRTGLPVVTCMGNTFQGRVAGSLLHAAGLPELITHNLRDYELLALALAGSPTRLAALRSKLERNLPACALFDIDRFRQHIEAAYVTMWERYQRGEAPQAFAVQAVAQEVAGGSANVSPAIREARPPDNL